MSHDKIVTRFAPSPTGYLHIGGARTALFNWAMARHFGGQFLLRLEDTDQQRSSDAAAESILEDLRWLGLDWDNAGKEPRQSKRLDLYNKYIDQLLAAGRAERDAGDPTVVRFKMPGTPITIQDEIRGTVTTPAEQLEDFVIRKSDGFPTFHLAVVVDDVDMGVTHVIRGQDHLTNTPKHWALQESLGFPHPIYMHISLTVNPDGSKLGKRDKAKAARKAAKERGLSAASICSWVQQLENQRDIIDPLRGEESAATSSSYSIELVEQFLAGENDDLLIADAIAKALDLELPEIEVRDFKAHGYLPKALINYLALLGWNPGSNIEDFGPEPLEFLRKHFDPKRFIKGNATFDREKLRAFNAGVIKRYSNQELGQLLAEHLDKYHGDVVRDYFHSEEFKRFLESDGIENPFPQHDEHRATLFASAYRDRIKTLSDVVEIGRFFFTKDDAIEFDSKAMAKVLEGNGGEGFAVLGELVGVLEGLEAWDAEGIEAGIKQFAEGKGLGMGKVAQPVRVAVSGSTVSPPIGLTLEILGKKSSMRRIKRCLEQVKGKAA